jgi:protease I
MQYGRQARKYMLLEAGHVAQNIQLQAVTLGLRSLTTAIFEPREVERTCRIPKEFEPTYILSAGHPLEQDQSEQGPLTGPGGVVFVVPNALFRDEELFETRFVLDQAGLNTIVAGARTGPVTGMLGNVVQAELTINELAVDNYDAIVFVGGPGAREYLKNSTALDIVREAAVKGKIIAAISTAPAILANAGVLQGIRATSFLTERGRLQQGGAIYTGTPVEVDGPIITARDPAAAALFGQAIADVLYRLP